MSEVKKDDGKIGESFARPSDLDLFGENEAARILGVEARTLQSWRVSGKPPAFIKIGRLVKYARIDIEKFIESQRRTSTSDAGR
jgi:Helix-turn-helix domain